MPQFCGLTIESLDLQLGLNGQSGELRIYCVEDVLSGDVPVIPAPDTPVTFTFGSLVFGGLLQQWGKAVSTSGERYTFTAVDPTAVLEAATVITGGYAAPITGANVLNAYGHAGFAGADPNESGMPWATVLASLGTFFAGGGAPYGGPIAYRGLDYTVDLSELPAMPAGYRVPAGVTSLAELIAQVCADAQLDFFVRLSGLVVQVKTRSRAAASSLGGTLTLLSGLSYSGLVTSQSIGVEASRETTGVVLLGGAKSDLQLTTALSSYWGDTLAGAPIVGVPFVHPDLPGEPCESFTLPCDHIADAVGAVTYPSNTIEMRCALGGYDTWSSYVKRYKSASAAEKAVGLFQVATDLTGLAKVDFIRDARNEVVEALKLDVQTRAMVIHNWLKGYAEEFYGKRYLARLDGVFATGADQYSARVDGAAWIDGGAAAIGLAPLDQDKFSDADGRILSFAEIPNVATLDPNELDPARTAVVGTSLLVQARVDPKLIASGGHVYAKVDLGDPVYLRTPPDGGDIFRIINGLGAGAGAHQVGGTLGHLSVFARAVTPVRFGVPLTSELETYGPWQEVGAEGRVDVVQDPGLVPWEYGGEAGMNTAALARVSGAASLKTTAEWAEVTFAGLPLASPGDVLVAGGPTLTAVSINYSTGGLTTTYRFASNTASRPATLGRQAAESIRRSAQVAREGRAKAIRAAAAGALRADGLAKAKSNRAFRRNAPKWVKKESPQEVVVASIVSTTGGVRTHAAATTAEEAIAIAFPTGDDSVWRNTAVSSWSAVVRPFEVVGPTGTAAGLVPPLRLAAAMTGANAGAITASRLSHLDAPHDVEVLSWGPQYTGINARSRNPSATGARSAGLRGPVVIQGWGHGLDGRLYPTGGSPSQYLTDHRRRPDQWKAGYLDPLWDEKRYLWTVHDVYTGVAPTGIGLGGSAQVRVGNDAGWELPVHAPYGAIPSGGSVVAAYAANEGRLIALPTGGGAVASGPNSYLLDVPCLVASGTSAVGMVGVVVNGDGSMAECVTKGFCGSSCGPSTVPPPPPPPTGEAMLAVRYDGSLAAPHTARVYDGAAWSSPASLEGGGYAFGPYPVGSVVTVELTAPTADICWVFYGVAGEGNAGGTGTSTSVPITGTVLGGNGVVVFYDCGEVSPSPPPPPPPGTVTTISGTVSRELAEGGGPLAGRAVELVGLDETVTTNAGGNYAFAGVIGGGTRFVRVALSGGEVASHSVDGGSVTPGNTADVVISESTHDVDFVIDAPPAATVNVTVRNAVGSTPLSGRTVTMGVTSRTTNGSGLATFTGVSPGSVSAVLTLGGGESASWAVDSPGASGKGATATFTAADNATHGVTFQVNLSGPGPGGGAE